MRRTLTRLLMLGLSAAPLTGIHAQKPGQTGQQPPYDSSVGPGYIEELTKRESEERRQIMTLSQRLGAEHPTVEELQRQLEFTQSELKKLTTNQPGNVDDKQVFNFFMGLTTGERTEPSEQQIRQAFAKLVKTLRSSSDKQIQEEARTKLSQLLKYQLDKDLTKQEEQIIAAERKLAKLREQLDARKQNQDKVADVLLLMIENPEAGVGIPSEWLRAIMPPPGRATSDPFGDTSSSNPFGDPFGGSSPGDDPFGGPSSDDDDPFGGSPSAKSDPFSAAPSGGDDPFGADPFGEASSQSQVAQYAEVPPHASDSDPFGGQSPAYEVSLDGHDIAVYETYDKGVPILTRQEMKIGLGEGESIQGKSYGSIWMTQKGIVEIRPHPTEEYSFVIVGLKKGRVQLAFHPRSTGMSQGIHRINVEVTEEDLELGLPEVQGKEQKR